MRYPAVILIAQGALLLGAEAAVLPRVKKHTVHPIVPRAAAFHSQLVPPTQEEVEAAHAVIEEAGRIKKLEELTAASKLQNDSTEDAEANADPELENMSKLLEAATDATKPEDVMRTVTMVLNTTAADDTLEIVKTVINEAQNKTARPIETMRNATKPTGLPGLLEALALSSKTPAAPKALGSTIDTLSDANDDLFDSLQDLTNITAVAQKPAKSIKKITSFLTRLLGTLKIKLPGQTQTTKAKPEETMIKIPAFLPDGPVAKVLPNITQNLTKSTESEAPWEMTPKTTPRPPKEHKGNPMLWPRNSDSNHNIYDEMLDLCSAVRDESVQEYWGQPWPELVELCNVLIEFDKPRQWQRPWDRLSSNCKAVVNARPQLTWGRWKEISDRCIDKELQPREEPERHVYVDEMTEKGLQNITLSMVTAIDGKPKYKPLVTLYSAPWRRGRRQPVYGPLYSCFAVGKPFHQSLYSFELEHLIVLKAYESDDCHPKSLINTYTKSKFWISSALEVQSFSLEVNNGKLRERNGIVDEAGNASYPDQLFHDYGRELKKLLDDKQGNSSGMLPGILKGSPKVTAKSLKELTATNFTHLAEDKKRIHPRYIDSKGLETAESRIKKLKEEEDTLMAKYLTTEWKGSQKADLQHLEALKRERMKLEEYRDKLVKLLRCKGEDKHDRRETKSLWADDGPNAEGRILTKEDILKKIDALKREKDNVGVALTSWWVAKRKMFDDWPRARERRALKAKLAQVDRELYKFDKRLSEVSQQDQQGRPSQPRDFGYPKSHHRHGKPDHNPEHDPEVKSDIYRKIKELEHRRNQLKHYYQTTYWKPQDMALKVQLLRKVAQLDKEREVLLKKIYPRKKHFTRDEDSLDQDEEALESDEEDIGSDEDEESRGSGEEFSGSDEETFSSDGKEDEEDGEEPKPIKHILGPEKKKELEELIGLLDVEREQTRGDPKSGVPAWKKGCALCLGEDPPTEPEGDEGPRGPGEDEPEGPVHDEHEGNGPDGHGGQYGGAGPDGYGGRHESAEHGGYGDGYGGGYLPKHQPAPVYRIARPHEEFHEAPPPRVIYRPAPPGHGYPPSERHHGGYPPHHGPGPHPQPPRVVYVTPNQHHGHRPDPHYPHQGHAYGGEAEEHEHRGPAPWEQKWRQYYQAHDEAQDRADRQRIAEEDGEEAAEAWEPEQKYEIEDLDTDYDPEYANDQTYHHDEGYNGLPGSYGARDQDGYDDEY
ncbi:hypothetical protein S40293_07497 [Stachybotrys chartarum IBT 40293]|nr:hypothetical protein S40293_07497 [Stachybotrys chartarum IBT 40293]